MSINVNTLVANFDAGVSNYALHELKEISTALKPQKNVKMPQFLHPDTKVSIQLDYLARQLHVLNGGRPSRILVDYVHRNLDPKKQLPQGKKRRYPDNQKAVKLFNRYRQMAVDDALALGLEGAEFDDYILAGVCARSSDTVARLFNRNYQHTYTALKEQTATYLPSKRKLFLSQASTMSGPELRLFISLTGKAMEMLEIIIHIMDALDENTRLIFLQETDRQKKTHLIPFLKIAQDAIAGQYLNQLFSIMAALSDKDLSLFLTAITKTSDKQVMMRMMKLIQSLPENERPQFLYMTQIPTKDDFYIVFNAFETITNPDIRTQALSMGAQLPDQDLFNYIKTLAHSEKLRDLALTALDHMTHPDEKSHLLFLGAWHPKYVEKVYAHFKAIKNDKHRVSFLNVAVNADHLLASFLHLYETLKKDQLHNFLTGAEKNIDTLFEYFTQVEEKKGYDRVRFLSEV